MLTVRACNALLCWDWENTLQQRTPSSLSITSRTPLANTRLCSRHSTPPCTSFERQPHNWVPKSHEITNVNRHITYLSGKMTLTEFCRVFPINHAFFVDVKSRHIPSFNIRLAFLIFNTSKATYCKLISFFFIKPSSLWIACGKSQIRSYLELLQSELIRNCLIS